LPAGNEGLDEPRDRCDLAVQKACEIDHVRAEIAERAGARLGRVEAPRGERRIVSPVLEIAPAEMPDLPELARLDQLTRKADRRHEAVVERAEVLDTGRGDAAPDLVGLVAVAS
jgi:hypothetical protein